MFDKFTKLKDKKKINQLRNTDSVIIENDFTKRYTVKTKNLLIQSKDKSIDMELLSSYHQMLGVGEETLVAEIKLNDWKNKDNLFYELGFYDRKNWNKKDKQFIFKWCEEKTIQIELPADFPKQARGDKMFEKIIGDWDNATEFTKLSELPHKNIRIGIFTETILDEKIEWLPTINGFDIYEWAAYDVTAIHEFEHDTANGDWNSLLMIDTTHFILAYTGDNQDGTIKTFSINGSYTISQIDVLIHDATNDCIRNSLSKIDSTHFVLAYTGTGNIGLVKTFSIDGSYDNIAEIDVLQQDVIGQYNSVVVIDTTHFILAYTGDNQDGYIKTFSIDGSYDNITLVNSLEHDTVAASQNSLVMINSTHFILSYAVSSGNTKGTIKTFSIDGSYVISQIDSFEHTSTADYENSLLMIDTTHFILAYRGDSGDGYIKTFSIDGSYDNIAEIDVLEYDVAGAAHPSVGKIDSTHFIVAFQHSGGHAYIETFSIDESYDNITEITSLDHDTLNYANSIVVIDNTHCILAYYGPNWDGFIKTFNIAGPTSIKSINGLAYASVKSKNGLAVASIKNINGLA